MACVFGSTMGWYWHHLSGEPASSSRTACRPAAVAACAACTAGHSPASLNSCSTPACQACLQSSAQSPGCNVQRAASCMHCRPDPCIPQQLLHACLSSLPAELSSELPRQCMISGQDLALSHCAHWPQWAGYVASTGASETMVAAAVAATQGFCRICAPVDAVWLACS